MIDRLITPKNLKVKVGDRVMFRGESGTVTYVRHGVNADEEYTMIRARMDDDDKDTFCSTWDIIE